MKKIARIVLGAVGLIFAPALLMAAAIPLLSGPQDISQTQAVINGVIRNINALISPQSMAPFSNPTNFIDNGAMNVQQRGTGIQTCGTATAPTATAFSADRWVCDVNVTSGAGRSQVVAAGATTGVQFGFLNTISLYRTSGALTQPVCVMQQIPAARSAALAGQPVMLSFYAWDLGGLVTDNAGAITAKIITGTGTDEGFGTLTASPAVTPAWTGIATAVSQAFTVNATAQRFNLPTAVAIPAAALEVGVQICFTPTATGAGVTDGFGLTGVQLEAVAATATAASPYEFRAFADEIGNALRYYYQINEPASGAAVDGFCQATGATAGHCTVPFLALMRGTTPTVTITTGTFKVNIAGTATTWVTPTASTCSIGACDITIGNTNTAGQVEQLTGGGGSGIIAIMQDKVF